MAENKKYFWLKLKDDFFKTKEIKKLRKIAGGDTYTIIYLKMQLLSIKNEGKLYFEGIEDNFIDELSLELDEPSENIEITLNYLKMHNLIEESETDSYLLPKVLSSIGKESDSAERVRKHRAIKDKENKMLQCNVQVTNCNTEIEKELEKELEKEKDIKLYSLWSEEQLKKIFIKYPDIDLFVYENKILDYELKENKKYSNYLSALNTFVANDKKYNKDYIKEFKETVKPRIVYELDEEGHEIKF